MRALGTAGFFDSPKDIAPLIGTIQNDGFYFSAYFKTSLQRRASGSSQDVKPVNVFTVQDKLLKGRRNKEKVSISYGAMATESDLMLERHQAAFDRLP
ncbi:hypothetical protein [Duganella sp. CF458]|uniref:hypothetical protein n=1 Tax=Duganella sp. CF458 TaxID=1884368 RepID=UPI000B82BE97|nr:hypothetical protein [Duganella sp. CF458]